jgi:hypothetical protein
MRVEVSWKGKKDKKDPVKNLSKSGMSNPVAKSSPAFAKGGVVAPAKKNKKEPVKNLGKSSPAFEKGGVMNAKPKHPAVRKQSVASKVASAVKGAVKGAVGGKTKQHPAMRANKKGNANIAANRAKKK